MRKIISLILCLISLPAAAQIIPPRYAGSDDPDVFRKQFEKKVTKVMKRDGYRIEELSHELLMKFTIDTLGRCVDVQYPDSLGGVRFNPTQRSRELLNTALSELNPFTPAYKDGRKIPYVRKMLINMNFLPGAFVKPTFRGKKDGLMAFREYLNRNLVYDTKLYEAGVYGTVRVEFYIEPDGTITLVGASESPHPALTEHVQKLILDTSGTMDAASRNGASLPVSDLFSRKLRSGRKHQLCHRHSVVVFQQEGNGRTAICSRAFAEKPYFCGEQINLALRPVCVIFVPK